MESFLGMEVEHSDNKIFCHLNKYIKHIIDEFSNISAKIDAKPVNPISVPSQPGLLITRDDCPLVED
jgi:hypothetical protein